MSGVGRIAAFPELAFPAAWESGYGRERRLSILLESWPWQKVGFCGWLVTDL